MKKCNNCGALLDDNVLFCTSCGAQCVPPLYAEPQKISQSDYKWIYIFGGIAIFVLMALAGAYFYLQQKESPDIITNVDNAASVPESFQAEINAYLDNLEEQSAATDREQDEGCGYEEADGNIIYKAYSNGIYCNGEYPSDAADDNAQYFTTNLQELNRSHFKISFDFIAEVSNYVLVLSDGWRIMGVFLGTGNRVWITTNNQEHRYITNTRYALNERVHIDIVHNNGKLWVNGEEFNVEMNVIDGDNNLSSCNFANGMAFKGTLENIVVVSY